MSKCLRTIAIGLSTAAVVALASSARRVTAQAPAPIRTVFVIVFENTSWSAIAGNPAAPYINALLSQASHAEWYFTPPGLHPSAPNYMWLEAGRDFGFAGGSTFSPSLNSQNTTNHLVTQLANAGLSWNAYEEGIAAGECPLADSGLYAVRHDPFVFFNDVTDFQNVSSPTCVAHVRPYTEFAGDLLQNTVARYNFIKPNLCHDMHDCGVAAGDAWLAAELPRILSSQAYRTGGAVFITWDEGNGSTEDGPLGLIALSPAAKGNGYSNTTYYTHSSLLLTLQEIFGVGPLLGDASNATDLSDLFASFPAVTPSAPVPADTSSGVASNVTLRWSSSGGADSVYFGASNPPPLVATGVSARTYTPPPLTMGVQYFWQIVSNTAAGTTQGPVWTFTAGPKTLPGSWTSADVGAVTTSGNASFATNVFTLRSGGPAIGGTADAFEYVNQTFGGDADMTVRITSVQPAVSNAHVGLMMRDTMDPQSPYTMVDIRTDGVIEFSQRSSVGGASTARDLASAALPVWLKLTRRGTSVSAAISSDGSAWTSIANAAVVTAPSLLAGVVATTGGAAVSTVTVDRLSLVSASATGWTTQDIGGVGLAGSATAGGGTITVQAAGADIWGNADSFNYTSQPLTGDGVIVARVTSLQNTNVFAKAGVMFRDVLTADAVDVILDVRPGGAVEFMTRSTTGGATAYVTGATQVIPAWLKLTRSGATFTGAVSADGVAWATVGSVVIPSMGASAYVGLAVTSHTTSTLTTATFDNVSVTPSVPSGPGVSWTTQDIGAVGIAGTASPAGNTFSVQAAGADIWGAVDSFNYTSTPAASDGQIVVRVASLVNTNTFAKAGVMWRDTASASSAHVILDVRPDGGIEFMTRSATGSVTTVVGTGLRPIPAWLRLTRSGSTFLGAVSADGVSWTPVGTTSVALGSSATVGLAVTSHTTAVSTTAMFDSISVTLTPPSGTTPWTTVDVGSVGAAGSATINGSAITMQASGADIWGTADSFTFTSQLVNGDATIVARVTALQNTNAHAKAGVMFRETLAAGSVHVILDSQPDGSIEFMSRQSTGASTLYLAGDTLPFPAWLRLVRTGSMFSAAVSADGVTWRAVGSVTLSMAANAYVGLSVTSHVTSSLTTATYDNITTSP